MSKAIELTAEQYKTIIEELIAIIDEGVYIVDKNGIGIHYNKAMSDMEKVNVDDVLGRPFNEAFPDFSMGESTLFGALKKNAPTVKQQQTYKNLYGKEITTINSTIPIVANGETVAALEVAKDITGIRKMSDTLLELQEISMDHSNSDKKNSLENRLPIGQPGIKRYTFSDIYGENIEFKAVINRAKRAAENDASVVIFGETGTGKELLAQSIHFEGRRREKPFLAQNCAAIPETLLEGILFGTSKGAFTGAMDRAGLFEQASGGTLLLDEISAMPYDLQSKLLRVLQESYIRRIGGSKDIPVDVRIIATVNERPEDLIEQGKLRRDLYYRLNVINLSIPPLRERLDDIPVLVEQFLEKHNKKFGKEVYMASDGAIKRLKNYGYPGNVRELENIIEQAVSMIDREHVLTEKLLNMPDALKKAKDSHLTHDPSQPLEEYLAAVERRVLKAAMLEWDGNISKAAESLQIKRQTLQYKLKKYHI